jgi:hypothetical protein
VTELRFHRAIYRGTAVDEAVKMYTAYAEFELIETKDHFVVKIAGKSPVREKRVAGELGNYALGLTVRGARTGAGAP